ncbi:DEAD/DEAH box helicase [Pallidibacillus thermolactis]|jgi:superfamily II DNA/RNA helicase|uniref:DEAD/DEAH box helicase n=1 Tax=Pallidibacillus thermolactis TaxID=251051 RepID=UPI00156B8CD6|nr:DEAD/DEAH box helicase [Pallidibacillus thermolactis]MCU9601219.1 DEAD/DEAH box helicase [Pallidibacillus thermolactis subsp. kokeshiiformis]MED1672352.1 DEAD/DEAH box helicase [Pallidibacillus thermolactis subsp. kokeshiiformis]
MTNWSQLQTLKHFIKENWQQAGFVQPTPIQKQAIPSILEEKDVIAQSPTGSGKTLAYIIPILEQIDESKRDLQSVIIVPSRELAMQILEVIQKFTIGSDIKAAAFIGGANIKKQVEKLKVKPHIAVGTPGRIRELIKMKKMKMHQVKTIVIDEADQLMNQEHIQDVEAIIKSTLKERQLLFFSATITKNTEVKAKSLMKEDFVHISIENQRQRGNTDYFYIPCEQREKVEIIRKIMHAHPGRTITYIKNNEQLEEVALKLTFHGLPVAILTGDSTKWERKQALKEFRSNKKPLLLTTDVAARGLDIENIDLIIHYDFPSTSTQFIHRSGRTGRMGKKGTVISLVNAKERSFLKKMSQELKILMKMKKVAYGKIIDA